MLAGPSDVAERYACEDPRVVWRMLTDSTSFHFSQSFIIVITQSASANYGLVRQCLAIFERYAC